MYNNKFYKEKYFGQCLLSSPRKQKRRIQSRITQGIEIGICLAEGYISVFTCTLRE